MTEIELINKMAWKMARQNRYVIGDVVQAQKDLCQAGLEGYWLYKDAEYFPIKSIKQHMLVELAHLCGWPSWRGRATVKLLPTVPLDNINPSKLVATNMTVQAEQAMNYEKVYNAAVESDAGRGKPGQRTKHARTLRLFAKYGIGGKGKVSPLPNDISPDTYWYACKSLQKFAEGVLA